MFGVVPKTIWQRTNPADENNLCTWAMRCLLVETGDQLMLIDNGIGDKQSAKFFSYYYLHGDDSLKSSLHEAGFAYNDITDMFLTHLHFDHCGGGVYYKQGDPEKPEVTFPNARYWTNKAHWQWATEPNPREKASFLKENLLPMQNSGQLHFVDQEVSAPIPGMEIIHVDGHTEKQMLPKLRYKGKSLVFVADLLPSVGHIPVPYVMAYDTRPLLTMEEKAAFLQEACDNDYILFFEHDPKNECCTLKMTERGVRVDQVFALKDL